MKWLTSSRSIFLSEKWPLTAIKNITNTAFPASPFTPLLSITCVVRNCPSLQLVARVTTDDLSSHVERQSAYCVNWLQCKACFPSNATHATYAKNTRKVRKQRERTKLTQRPKRKDSSGRCVSCFHCVAYTLRCLRLMEMTLKSLISVSEVVV